MTSLFEPLTGQTGGNPGTNSQKGTLVWRSETFSISSTSDRTHTLSEDPIDNSVYAILNGVALSLNNDFTLNSDTLSIDGSVPLKSGWNLRVQYHWFSGGNSWDRFQKTFSSSPNRTMSLTHEPLQKSEKVVLNGVLLSKDDDYTISGKDITLDGNVPLQKDYQIDISYQYI